MSAVCCTQSERRALCSMRSVVPCKQIVPSVGLKMSVFGRRVFATQVCSRASVTERLLTFGTQGPQDSMQQAHLASGPAVATCFLQPEVLFLHTYPEPWKMQLLFEEFSKWLNVLAQATMMDCNGTFSAIFGKLQAVMTWPGTALKGLGEP